MELGNGQQAALTFRALPIRMVQMCAADAHATRTMSAPSLLLGQLVGTQVPALMMRALLAPLEHGPQVAFALRVNTVTTKAPSRSRVTVATALKRLHPPMRIGIPVPTGPFAVPDTK